MPPQTGSTATDLTAKVEALLEKEPQLLAHAVAQTIKRYHEYPSAKNLRDLEAAKKAMAKIKEDIVVTDDHELLLEKGYKEAEAAAKKKPLAENMKALALTKKLLDDYRASKAAPGEQPFKAINNVLDYLKDEGWKVSQSKLYEDKNKITQQRDGSWLKADIDKYATLYLTKRDGSDNHDLNDVARRKALAEAESAEHDAARKKRIEDCANGKLVLRTEVEQKNTAKLARLKTAVENIIYGGPMEEVVELLGGEVQKLPVVQKHLMEHFLLILAEYAKSSRFTIPKKSMLEAIEAIEAIRNAE